MVNERTAIIIILAIVVVAAIPVLVNMSMNQTGGFFYAGNTIQYESPQDACNSIACIGGPAEVFESSGGLWPYSSRRMVVKCYCPENPAEMYIVPMVRTLPLERY